MARRKRRMSSSLLPENMGPQMTSIHPMFANDDVQLARMT